MKSQMVKKRKERENLCLCGCELKLDQRNEWHLLLHSLKSLLLFTSDQPVG